MKKHLRPQDVATKKLAHARMMVAATTKKMRRLATSLALWEGRATYYAKRASMTDEEVSAERQRSKAKAEQRSKARVIRAVAPHGELNA